MSDLSTTLNAIRTPTRISGLSGSGLDTDSLVTKLMQADEIKYDEMKQDETYTEWKRDAYRDVMTKIKALTDKYFNDSINNKDPSNLLYDGAYSVFTGTITGTAGTGGNITAVGGAGTIEGTYHIKVDQVGTKASAVTSNVINQGTTAGDALYSGSSSLTFDLNGMTKSVTINAGATNADALTQIGNAFGINVSYNASMGQYTVNNNGVSGVLKQVDSSGNEITTNNFLNSTLGNSKLVVNPGIAPVAGVYSNAIAANGNSNTVTFSFGGKTQQFNINGLSVNDALSNIGNYFGIDITYSSLDDKYHISSSQAGSDGNGTLKQVNSTTDTTEVTNGFLKNVFGQNEVVMGSGQDAKVTITEPNGATNTTPITELTNNFTVDGVNYDIGRAKTGDEADVTMTQNVDDVCKKITGFLDDYNALIKNITDEINEKKSYSYKPLTDTQKKSMTTDQIKQWEDAGKVGILSNDSTIRSMLTSLRSSFFDSVQESGLTLSDLGLSTYGYPDVVTKAGQIQYNQDKLKSAIKKYGDRVGKIFAKKSASEPLYIVNNDTVKNQHDADVKTQRRQTRYNEEGIFWRISDIFEDYARPSNGYGTLSRIAGTVGQGNENENNILADQIKDQKKALDAFQTKMNEKEDEYYQKFAKLEAAMSQASAQQQWLQSQLG